MAKTLADRLPVLRRFLPHAVYALLAIVVLGPVLAPGYVLTLDMAFVPDLRLPETVRASYLFHAALHVLNFVIPSDVLQKCMLFFILFLSGLGAHQLVQYLLDDPRRTAGWGAYMAGAFYMVNPFTYSRLMTGQYAVLLGYALLPFFALTLFRFIAHPTTKNMLRLALLLVGISVVSIHTLGLAAVLGLIGVGLAMWRYRARKTHLLKLARLGLLGLSVFIIASFYWLVPLVRGTSTTANTIDAFGAGDQIAFATTGETLIGRLGNVLGLHGFWAENANLYLLPSDEYPALRLLIIPFLTLVIWGGIKLWRRQRFITAVLTASGLLGLILAAGVGISWLSAHVPFFAGYREPHKFAALVALTHAAFAGYGAASIFAAAEKNIVKTRVIATSFAALIVAITPLVFWGGNNQLAARQYPSDWHAANALLNRDPSEFSTLFLPWHLYMSFDFNERVVVNPAHDFFDKPTIINTDLEFGGASPNKHDPAGQILGQKLRYAPGKKNLGAELAPLDIKYVLLAQGTDNEEYEYLAQQTDLELISEGESLTIYRNSAWQEGVQK